MKSENLSYVLNYTPTPKQRMFHASSADEVLFGGAAGGGKSKAIVMDALFRCLKYPRTHAYVFRRTYGELEDTVIREARDSCPEGLAKYNAVRHEMTLPNGSVIHFRHCAHLMDMYNYKGVEIQWLYFDELTSFEGEIYEFLKTRLRAKKSLGVRPCVRSSSNPGDIGHGWVKKMFIDAAPYMQVFTREVVSSATGKKKVFRLQYIPSLVTENPHIGEDYLFQLESKPEALRNALLHGDWNAFEGQVFTEWTDDPAHYTDHIRTHVIAPFEIPTWWPRYMSFDHGYARPFSVGWWAVSPDGIAYRYREWYGCEPGRPNTGLRLTPRQIAEGILERETDERDNNLYIDRIADPAIFDRSRGDSVAQLMEPVGGRPGVYFRPGENNRLSGKMELHERLRFGENGKPKLYVFSNCRDFIRTVPALPYSMRSVEDVDSEAEDHIYDETRYFCMARPVKARERKRKTAGYDPFRERA
ncbi:MAG: phage terminase large subunit [Clostridia bacterium]|nr:phage terminase large subunit [Clostridia bacterium]